MRTDTKLRIWVRHRAVGVMIRVPGRPGSSPPVLAARQPSTALQWLPHYPRRCGARRLVEVPGGDPAPWRSLVCPADTGARILTVGDWLAHWLVSRTAAAPSTVRGYTAHVRLYLGPYLGEVLLAELSVAQVQAMFAAIIRQHHAAHRGGEGRRADHPGGLPGARHPAPGGGRHPGPPPCPGRRQAGHNSAAVTSPSGPSARPPEPSAPPPQTRTVTAPSDALRSPQGPLADQPIKNGA